jgi:hypothetical protein
MKQEERRMADKRQDDVEIVTLEFDDGTTMECEVMGIFDYNNEDYIALIPDDDSDDVYIYGYEEYEDGSYEILDIVNEELFQKVAQEFDKIMAEAEE